MLNESEVNTLAGVAGGWTDYEIIATGGGEKLERWGKLVLLRPDPQAIWQPPFKLDEYKGINARYIRSHSGGGSFAQGFLSATLLFCVGTMAIKGSLDSGLIGDHSTLFAKTVMDTVLALVFASSMGAGVLFSAVPVFLYQGAIALLAAAAQPFLGDAVIAEMNSVGSLLLFALALDMLGVLHLRLANFIPAMFFPILFCLFL